MESKIFVLGLDGLPYSFIKGKKLSNQMKNLTLLCEKGNAKRMNSVYPTVSSVAWTSFVTGTNPGQHGIYGFTDLSHDRSSLTLPTSTDRMAKPIWEQMPKGKKSIVVNVPLTYPPQPIDGIMVSCFLCTDIKKSTYPQQFHTTLQDIGYIIDVDAWMARTDKKQFLQALITATDKRFQLAFSLMAQEPWNYFQLHIMETDRLLHFFCRYFEQEIDDSCNLLIDRYLKLLDEHIGMLHYSLVNNCQNPVLVILSDHGFCRIKAEVQINHWLEANGYLRRGSHPLTLCDCLTKSCCISLAPGRIYFNRKDYSTESINQIKSKLKTELLQLRDPQTGEKVIHHIFEPVEIYSGNQVIHAPDLILHPENGYDLKAALDIQDLFSSSAIDGMHTYEDAMVAGLNMDVSNIRSIDDVINEL